MEKIFQRIRGKNVLLATDMQNRVQCASPTLENELVISLPTSQFHRVTKIIFFRWMEQARVYDERIISLSIISIRESFFNRREMRIGDQENTKVQLRGRGEYPPLEKNVSSTTDKMALENFHFSTSSLSIPFRVDKHPISKIHSTFLKKRNQDPFLRKTDWPNEQNLLKTDRWDWESIQSINCLISGLLSVLKSDFSLDKYF